MAPGSWLVADNVVYPGAPGYLEYLDKVPEAAAGKDDDVSGQQLQQPRYANLLVPFNYEYEQRWNPNWEPKKDALSFSICVAGSASSSASSAPDYAAAERQLRTFVASVR